MPEFREAMRLKPRWPAPMAGAALLLATHPNPAARQAGEAIRLARRASELTGFRDSGMLSILAISYAGAGRFDEAVASQHKVLDLVSASADPNLIAEANAALDLYRRGIPRR